MKLKLDKWKISIGLLLIVLSFVFYLAHYVIFRDAHHLFIFLVGDIAFVFIEVLLVTMILHELLSYRDKNNMLAKMNMVIGAFFSEVGTTLLKSLSGFDNNNAQMKNDLVLSKDWSVEKFSDVYERLGNYDHNMDVNKGELEALKGFLVAKRVFLLNLLQNPNLLEHESFTDLLWAVFHLTEELENRSNVWNLSDSDKTHITGDMKRAYSLLISEWLNYMKHLSVNYPYLFSLALRTNPFNPNATPEIK